MPKHSWKMRIPCSALILSLPTSLTKMLFEKRRKSMRKNRSFLLKIRHASFLKKPLRMRKRQLRKTPPMIVANKHLMRQLMLMTCLTN